MKAELSGWMKTVQILYGISFIGFVFRTMHYLVVLEKFGEKIMVLQKLVWDIVVFGVLFFGFALSYGVLTQASFQFNYFFYKKTHLGQKIEFKTFGSPFCFQTSGILSRF